MRLLGVVVGIVLLLGLVGCDWGAPAAPTPAVQATVGPTATSAQVVDAVDVPSPTPGPGEPSGGVGDGSEDVPPTFAVPQQTPVSFAVGHPRLWLTADDVTRLRSWATGSNQLWSEGLARLAAGAKAAMDDGRVPAQDGGTDGYEEYPVEMYSELFAFMSLVSPDAAERDDYAKRARTLLMYALNEAAKGPEAGQAFRDPEFYAGDSDRARWHGEGWALTVDWIYPSLTAEDKATIRKVFLRWSKEIVERGYHHPEPVGMVNDPFLTSNIQQVRWAANNYFSANMRNLGLMAMALDPADDPEGELGRYLGNATGASLYIADELYRTDARGGLAPEGFEYTPQAVGYVAQLLLALHTAGQDDPGLWGPQVQLSGNPFWKEILPVYFHTLSPATVANPDLGQVYQPGWYGDGQRFWAPDFIEVFGPLGIFSKLLGDQAQADAMRWVETNTPPGLQAGLLERVGGAENFRDSILYFMLMEPKPLPPDPHVGQPLTYYAPGLGHIYARTGWGADATWFGYTLGWNTVDHQHADGNNFHFYRNGEWLTKETTGYDTSTSNYHNTLALENDPPEHNDPSDYRHDEWLQGSQWILDPTADGKIVAHSFGDKYVYALGDATGLYNSSYEGANDITQATRSIVWLEPDYVVVYDRAASKTENMFKRFWLQLPGPPSISGNRATVSTEKGQQLFLTSLAPEQATLSSAEIEAPQNGEIADEEPMKYNLKIEAAGNPRETRFLTVLQGADAGASASSVEAIQSSSGTAFSGVAVGKQVVMFPVVMGSSFAGLEFSAPGDSSRVLITGLAKGSSYDVEVRKEGGKVHVKVAAGSKSQVDEGGVLVVDVP
ncbi:MAG: hypothetical protein ABI670_09465 [Chloroflexota bacterium]